MYGSVALVYFLVVIAVLFIAWFVNLLREALRIKAISGFWDKIIIAFLFFLGIIFAIIYLSFKINKKQKHPQKIISSNTKKEIKNFWKRFWFIVWKDDSLKGWLISILFLFIVIKFIFFPTLNLLTGTQLPLAIVESCSMYHDGNLLSNFDNWYERHDTKYEDFIINKLDFEDFIFKNGFNKGDILFVVGAKPEKLKIGDVIIFAAGQQNPVIHRIIDIRQEGGKYYFSTIGDNNNGQLSFETSISEDQLIGKAVLKIAPYLGWAKLIFFEPMQPSYNKGFCEEN